MNRQELIDRMLDCVNEWDTDALVDYAKESMETSLRGLTDDELMTRLYDALPQDEYDEIAAKVKQTPRCYTVTLLLELPGSVWGDWDSSCDETFGIASLIDASKSTRDFYGVAAHITQIEPVSQDYVDTHKHDIFDENGGI